jgi:hypothetical protein
MGKLPLLRLKRDELVPADEDRQVELAIYDLLLPCRRFDISYKVAVLGGTTPTLEFLLRLLKSVPGISEDDAMLFLGFSRRELEYVLDEGTGPGYIERDEGRLWLTTAGDGLFTDAAGGPSIFSVEGRRGSYGFDLLAMAPERPKSLDRVEMLLPDLKLEDHSSAGTASQQKIPDSFRRFFRDLGERKDREQIQKRDLYSIDNVVAGDRFQVPVRIRVLAQASSPHIGEIDLSSWRPDHDVADRPEIEQAAGRFMQLLETPTNPEISAAAYQKLIVFAPEFLKEYTTRAGLSVNRYWREAVSRAGEVRADRKTVPIVGALVCQENIERLLRVIDYGRQDAKEAPPFMLSVPPQVTFWGATSILKEVLGVVRRRVSGETRAADENDVPAVCVVPGNPARYVGAAFDHMDVVDRVGHSPAMEFFVVPNVAAAVLVHAPIGSSNGLAAPLGFASFDPAVLQRVQSFVVDSAIRYVADLSRRERLERGLAAAEPQPAANDDMQPSTGK